MALGIIPAGFYEWFLNNGYEWLLWVIAAGSLGLLGLAADRVVSSAVVLASDIGLSKIVIGATIVSLGTTAPEVSVSVLAAIRGEPELALGNAVGSVTCDIALIFGLACVLTRLPIDRFVLSRQGTMLLATSFTLVAAVGILAILNGSSSQVVIPRWMGAAFLAGLLAYLYLSVRWARRKPQTMLSEQALKAQVNKQHKIRQALANLVFLIIALAFVVFSSDTLVGSAIALSLHYGVPKDVLAVTLVAFGTSVPELATAMASVAKRHGELLIGNTLGASILCILWVLGASSSLAPLAVPKVFVYLHLPVMLSAVCMISAFILLSGQWFRRWQGALLLTVYTGYICVLAALMLT